jgi:hypothetical protein
MLSNALGVHSIDVHPVDVIELLKLFIIKRYSSKFGVIVELKNKYSGGRITPYKDFVVKYFWVKLIHLNN